MITHRDWVNEDTLLTASSEARPQAYRDAVWWLAQHVNGLASSKSDYADFICSPETLKDPGLVDSMKRMSGCALTVLSIWRHMGVPNPELWTTYKIGKAVAWVVQVAKAQGAWNSKIRNTHDVVQAGDVVLVAAPEHVFTCIGDPEITEEGNGSQTFRFPALHGGGRTADGFQLIDIRPTTLIWARGKLWYGAKSVVGIARGAQFTPTRAALLPPRSTSGSFNNV